MSKLKVDRQKSQHVLMQLTDQLYNELHQSTLKHWLSDPKVEKHLEHKVKEWAFQAKSNLDQQHPYIAEQQHLEYWMKIEDITQSQFNEMIKQYREFSNILGFPDLTDIWQSTQQKSLTASTIWLQSQLLQEKWQRQLTEAIAHWEFEQLALQRDVFLDDIKDFLAMLQRMAKHKDSLGIETGILIDYSKGNLSSQDIHQFEQWAEYLEKDVELMHLCRLIGSAQPIKNHRKALQVVQENLPDVEMEDIFVQEEFSGIKLAQELNLALPSELALLADPELQLWFDLKYIESNLMSFNTQGQHNKRVVDEQRQYKKKVGQKGPMIICLDTSGSMHGQPELISKAICLYLSIQALKSKRALYIINFSTNLTTLNLQQNHAFDDLIHFLSQSFHGGTDIIPALTHATEMLKQPYFDRADVVVISDFIMGNLTAELMETIQINKQHGHGFYAVAIGNFRFDHLDESLFDHQWIYQSNTRKIVQLN